MVERGKRPLRPLVTRHAKDHCCSGEEGEGEGRERNWRKGQRPVSNKAVTGLSLSGPLIPLKGEGEVHYRVGSGVAFIGSRKAIVAPAVRSPTHSAFGLLCPRSGEPRGSLIQLETDKVKLVQRGVEGRSTDVRTQTRSMFPFLDLWCAKVLLYGIPMTWGEKLRP